MQRSRPLMSWLLVLVGTVLASQANASPLQVNYTIDAKPLKRALTPVEQLTFRLYADAACTEFTRRLSWQARRS